MGTVRYFGYCSINPLDCMHKYLWCGERCDLSHALRSAVRSLDHRRVTYAPGNPKLWGPRAGYSHRGVHAESGGATPPPQHNSSPFIHPLSDRHVAPQTNSLKLANNGITAGITPLVGPMSTRSTREAPSTERVVVLFCGIMSATSWEPQNAHFCGTLFLSRLQC